MNTSSASLEQINQRLIKINDQYQKVFNDPRYRSPLLNRKAFSLLMQSIYTFLQTGTIEAKLKNKQIFLSLFRSYINNFINSHILLPLERLSHYDDFQPLLSQKWRNFKQFTFYYFALLQSANSSYQTVYFTSLQSGIQLNIKSEKSIFPIPVIALHQFKTLVLNKHQQKLEHVILNSIKNCRLQLKYKPQSLKNSLQLIWACGLSELARVRILPVTGVDFYKEERVQFVSKIKIAKDTEEFFSQRILNYVLKESELFYHDQYESKLRPLYPIQQFKAIKSSITRQFEFCQQFFLTKTERRRYMSKIYENLVFNDLQERLKAPGSFKTLIQNFKFDSSEGFQDIRVFFEVLKGATNINKDKLKNAMKPVQNIFCEVISEQGKQINKKINKRRQYIIDMLILKKSIDKIVDELSNKNFILFSVKDKAFKKILDSIESSRNLADFTDFTIKQCIRLKLDEQRCYQKFSDIFLLLNSTTSTDSFLLYHQELLAKRIIDSLNEPKLQFQLLMLKKISERMGVMSVSPHMSMIKDIQLSQQLTQRYNNRLPFSSFKWNLKIFNPSYWPDNASKQKVSMQIPNYIFHQAKAIQDLYHGQNQYRYLNWKLQKGTSLFQGRFQNHKIRFQSQNSYIMILLLIAQQVGNKIIFGNLKQLVKTQKNQINTKHDALAMIIFVLLQSKLLLRKNVEDRFEPFLESEEIEINRKYTMPEGMLKGQQVVMIRPSPQIARNLQQSSIQKNKILKDREKTIEAVLVKALKHAHATRDNSITFEQLYKSVKEHPVLGGFNFSQNTVKQRLQQLIARQYCIRDEQDRKIYHYVA